MIENGEATMTFVKHLIGAAALVVATLISGTSQAGYIVTLTQEGTTVVASGSGTIDLTDLTVKFHGGVRAEITPSLGFILTGPTSDFTPLPAHTGFSGPSSFGPGILPFLVALTEIPWPSIIRSGCFTCP